jgi:nucleotide-binding universal stress UspA family protein
MRAIVVGVRGGPEADPALDFALEEAVRRRLPLEAVHCFEAVRFEDVPPVLMPQRLLARREASEQAVAEALEAAAQRIPGGETVAAHALAMDGTPAECLLSLVSRTALLVVGRRGGGVLRRGLRGSVSSTVLHHSWAPVALVPPEVPRVPDRWAHSRIVVGLDGSRASLSALTWGVEQAQEWGSVLAPVVVSSLTGRAPLALSERTPDLTAATWSAVREAGGQSVEVHPHFLEGSPSRALLAFVEPEDLLVVGSRGRGGPSSLVLGSTSTAVAEKASCTVVVVREGQARREVHQRRSQVRGSVLPR